MFDQAAVHELLKWYAEVGVDEAIGDTPVNRYALPQKTERKQTRPQTVRRRPPATERPADPVTIATALARKSDSIAELKAAMSGFDLCELKKGARNFVFSDGNPAAKVMIVGEAPGRDEDVQGRPFVGRAGKLLDRMFGQIGLGRHQAGSWQSLYIANVVPWRPPSNRTPTMAEIKMMRPFISRHIELISPCVLIAMGNVSCTALIGQAGITRIRGKWNNFKGTPILPMFHPAYLLRNPEAKGETWDDLLEVRKLLRDKRNERN